MLGLNILHSCITMIEIEFSYMFIPKNKNVLWTLCRAEHNNFFIVITFNKVIKFV